MKKLSLKLDGIKEMLTKEQMKKITVAIMDRMSGVSYIMLLMATGLFIQSLSVQEQQMSTHAPHLLRALQLIAAMGMMSQIAQ